MRNRFTGYLTTAERNGDQDNLLYYVRGALGLLTTEGELYYDESQNKLYLWAPGGGMPENVEYKARNWGFDLTGRNVTIENNYFKDFGYIGNWSSSITASIVITGLTIYGNTFWRTGRVHVWNVQRMSEVAFNDWSEYSYLNVDGGGNYSQARFSYAANHGANWNEAQYSQYYGHNLLAWKESPPGITRTRATLPMAHGYRVPPCHRSSSKASPGRGSG